MAVICHTPVNEAVQHAAAAVLALAVLFKL